MVSEVFQIVSNGSTGALIVSEVCFLRESLAEILTRVARIPVCGESATLVQALAIARAKRPEIVLLDVAFPGGIEAATRLSSVVPEASVVALAVAETEENVFAWAKAGIAGYVPNTASINDLVSLIRQIRRGEQPCPSRIAGSLLRRIGASEHVAKLAPPCSSHLTRREFEISHLVAAGLSNKEIARRLGIGLGTTKSHVHTLLNKLSLRRRGEVAVRMNERPPSTLP